MKNNLINYNSPFLGKKRSSHIETPKHDISMQSYYSSNYNNSSSFVSSHNAINTSIILTSKNLQETAKSLEQKRKHNMEMLKHLTTNSFTSKSSYHNTKLKHQHHARPNTTINSFNFLDSDDLHNDKSSFNALICTHSEKLMYKPKEKEVITFKIKKGSDDVYYKGKIKEEKKIILEVEKPKMSSFSFGSNVNSGSGSGVMKKEVFTFGVINNDNAKREGIFLCGNSIDKGHGNESGNNKVEGKGLFGGIGDGSNKSGGLFDGGESMKNVNKKKIEFFGGNVNSSLSGGLFGNKDEGLMKGNESKNEKDVNKDNSNNNNSVAIKEGGLFGNIGKNDTIKQNEVKVGNDKPKISLDGLFRSSNTDNNNNVKKEEKVDNVIKKDNDKPVISLFNLESNNNTNKDNNNNIKPAVTSTVPSLFGNTTALPLNNPTTPQVITDNNNNNNTKPNDTISPFFKPLREQPPKSPHQKLFSQTPTPKNTIQHPSSNNTQIISTPKQTSPLNFQASDGSLFNDSNPFIQSSNKNNKSNSGNATSTIQNIFSVPTKKDNPLQSNLFNTKPILPLQNDTDMQLSNEPNLLNPPTQPQSLFGTQPSLFNNPPSSNLFPIASSSQFIPRFALNIPNSANQQSLQGGGDLVFNIGTKKTKTQY